MKITNQEKIQNLLTRNVEDLIAKEEIEKNSNQVRSCASSWA